MRPPCGAATPRRSPRHPLADLAALPCLCAPRRRPRCALRVRRAAATPLPVSRPELGGLDAFGEEETRIEDRERSAEEVGALPTVVVVDPIRFQEDTKYHHPQRLTVIYGDQSSGMVWFIVAACKKFAVRAFGDCRVCYLGLELGVWVTLAYLSQPCFACYTIRQQRATQGSF